MGCTQSKIENEEAVARCKERKIFMKEAVSARNAFAAAHSSYGAYLKNTGAALSDFAQGEIQNPQSVPPGIPNSTLTPQPIENLPPPPPLPNFSAPLQRAASMPEMKMSKPEIKPVGTIDEGDEENELENDGSSLNGSLRRRSSRNNGGHSRIGAKEVEEEATRTPMPPPSKPETQPETHHPMPQPPQNSAWEYFFPPMENIPGTSLSEEEVSLNNEEIDRKAFDEKPKRVDAVDEGLTSKQDEGSVTPPEPMPMPEKVVDPPEPPAAVASPMGKGPKKVKQGASSVEKRIVRPNVNIMQIFNELDDHFLKASESAHEVSKMLEATRLHYHSNFADNRGHIDHSARVMRVITWNRSFRGMPNMDDGKDDFESEEDETHAAILDKLLAWEKKLYEEVKAGELMKFEYQKKVANLNRQKKRGTNSEALEKAKAAVSLLHTRYIVDMQSMDSTVSEISRLRDEQLYAKLVELVDGMATMWETMHARHESQSNIVMALKSWDISQSPKETSEHHHDRTFQLLAVVHEWRKHFEGLVNHQKGYIKSLNNWLKLNLIPIESNLKEKVSSPPRTVIPPIQRLLHAWHDYLEKLPDELARTAISNFAALIETILHQQEEELLLKRKCEDTQKEHARKGMQFEDWHRKYMERKIPDDHDPDNLEGINGPDEVVTEKQFMVEQVKRRLEDEKEAHERLCLQVRQKSLGSLKNGLPELFRAMSSFTLECSRMYCELRSISEHLNSVQSPS
ncbi:hypothetical protein L6164_021549 [Bauhinia variegata]|uniref:Uncharacterized protein n=1 Tax=Bauhinia variegata TaxID=167791 RepID=A0ACB9MZE6_BAUVA|nr:hypothetical protein L6164_021549 [Bauhinia variegata]